MSFMGKKPKLHQLPYLKDVIIKHYHKNINKPADALDLLEILVNELEEEGCKTIPLHDKYDRLSHTISNHFDSDIPKRAFLRYERIQDRAEHTSANAPSYCYPRRDAYKRIRRRKTQEQNGQLPLTRNEMFEKYSKRHRLSEEILINGASNSFEPRFFKW